MINVKQIQHIGLIVPDAEASADWYSETAGFKRKAVFFTGSGIKAVFIWHEDMSLMYELIQHPNGSDIARKAEREGAWLDHIAYEVSDLEKELGSAKEQGLLIIEGICNIPEFWDNGFEYFLIRAPGGEKVEFCRVL